MSKYFFNEKYFYSIIFSNDLISRERVLINKNEYINPFKKFLIIENKNDNSLDKKRAQYIRNYIMNYDDKKPFFIHFHLMDTHTIDPILYEKGMLSADLNIQYLYSALKDKNLLDKSILIVTSDHNQGWKTLKPIPLLIRFPYKAKSREHFNRNTQIIDLAPTVLDYIGIKKPFFMGGKSFLNKKDIIEERAIYSVSVLETKNSFSKLNKYTSGITQVKVQICNKYLLEDLDEKGQIIKTMEYRGYAQVLPCSKEYNFPYHIIF